ncbi:MAG: branched-chain amino acid ABC transporter permease [Clostridia bacterium]|nr:branched-chain amino acid ABC transporter permease [Clostridia bacterium]
MEQFVQQLINGLSLGSIYALIALGYTMVYGIVKLINFAHGDIFMVGAYVGFVSITYFNMGFFPALLIAMLFCAVLGVVIEKVAYKPLRNASRITALITAIGVSLLLEYVVMFFAKAGVRTYPENVLPNLEMTILGVRITFTQVCIFAVTIALVILLQFIVHKTRVGKAMRAVSMDKDAAQLMGINVNNTISVTFAIGSALAGAAGILVGVYYNSIDPLMGIIPGLKAFVAAVFGGIGIIPGAMIGGFSIGAVETMVSGYGSSLYKDAVAFAILILVLIVKPSGLLGKNTREKV